MKNLRRRGFSLMELIIMIAVAGALFTGLSRAVNNLIQKAAINREYLIALNIAKLEMAKINIGAFPGVDGAEVALTADPDFPSFIPTRFVTSVATSIGPPARAINLITVQVRRNSLTGSVLIRLDTYRTDLVSFGNGT